MFEGINYLAVIVATVLSMVLGMLWYSPMLFGKAWMKEMGISEEDAKKQKEQGMGKFMAIGSAMAFIFAFYLAHYIKGGADMGDVIQWGLGLWAGVIVTTHAPDYLWGKRSMKLFMINMLHHGVVIVAVAILLSLWK